MRDAFAVLFFVSVGMLFDPNILVQHPWQVLATTLIIVFGKSVAAYAIVRAFGHPNATALTISTSLAQIGEFAFIIAGLGLTLGILPKDGHSLVLAGALISIMLNPILFMALDRWQLREDARVLRNAPPEPAVVPMDIDGHAIIVGYGRVGSQLAHLLAERGVPLVVIEDDVDLVERARATGLPTIRGNAANPRVMLEAAPDRAKLAVFAIPQALEAGETIARLKALNPGVTVLARAHSEGQVRHLLQHGADAAVLAERELAYSLAEMVMAAPPYRQKRERGTGNGER
jgi:CPA2 family monovalent cation:H+ antiporter-2